MIQYYTLLQSRSHAFILSNRFRINNVQCELTYMPREIMKDLCNMGVKFSEDDYSRAINVIANSGLPGVKIYKEVMTANSVKYMEVQF